MPHGLAEDGTLSECDGSYERALLLDVFVSLLVVASQAGRADEDCNTALGGRRFSSFAPVPPAAARARRAATRAVSSARMRAVSVCFVTTFTPATRGVCQRDAISCWRPFGLSLGCGGHQVVLK
jgi:hypothetical protein